MLLKYLSIKDGLKRRSDDQRTGQGCASKVPVHKRWIETNQPATTLNYDSELLKYLSIKDGLKLIVQITQQVIEGTSKVPVHKRWIETHPPHA